MTCPHGMSYTAQPLRTCLALVTTPRLNHSNFKNLKRWFKKAPYLLIILICILMLKIPALSVTCLMPYFMISQKDWFFSYFCNNFVQGLSSISDCLQCSANLLWCHGLTKSRVSSPLQCKTYETWGLSKVKFWKRRIMILCKVALKQSH